MVPGTAASILLIVTTIVTAMGLAREREIGTMEQLFVTPIRPIEFILGKTTADGFVGASSLERMGVEDSLTNLTREFKAVRR